MSRRYLAFLLFLPLLADAATADYIAAIRFEGNAVTRERILRQELEIAEGQPLDLPAVERSRQSLLDLGLFRKASSRIEGEGPGKTVVFSLKERYYILPLPRLDGDLNDVSLSYGVELRMDNVAGLNQRVRINYRNKEFDDERDTSRIFGVSYRYPRVFGSRFELGVDLGIERQDETLLDASGEGLYRQDSHKVGFEISRWLTNEGPSRGALAGVGIGLEARDYQHISGTQGLAEGGEVVELTGRIANLDVHDLLYWQEGSAYGYNVAVAAGAFGSDHDYWRNELFWRRYRHFSGRGGNLNTRLRIGVGHGERFGADAYRVGDADTLRGYEKDYATGDALLLGNIEYLHPISGYRQMHAALFADVGNVYPRLADIDPSDLLVGVGVGLRWRVQSFVNVYLRVEAAYGVEAGTEQFYAGTSVPF